ncbi:MAG: UDP-N-acetylmuramate dehydrogenase, partial [Candidatus Eisenbacteria bacterium]
GVGGPADWMVFPGSAEELRGVLRLLGENDVPRLVVGAGSDLVVRDGGFRGACIVLARHLSGSKIVGDRAIEAMAGESLASLLRLSREASLAGLEFVATIPGTVGGGVVTNVGAFGSCFADILESVAVLDAHGRERAIEGRSLRAAYRRIELPEGAVVVRARFALEPGARERIEETVARHREHRLRTQPLGEASAGCIYKNPSPGEPAGRLIDQAGLTGLRLGGASVSALHANYIVNEGGATAREVLALIDEVRRRVSEKHGVLLEPEVRIVGEE